MSRVYRAHELLFAVLPYDQEGRIEEMKIEGLDFIVVLTRKTTWEKEKQMDDNLGGHNISVRDQIGRAHV